MPRWPQHWLFLVACKGLPGNGYVPCRNRCEGIGVIPDVPDSTTAGITAADEPWNVGQRQLKRLLGDHWIDHHDYDALRNFHNNMQVRNGHIGISSSHIKVYQVYLVEWRRFLGGWKDRKSVVSRGPPPRFARGHQMPDALRDDRALWIRLDTSACRGGHHPLCRAEMAWRVWGTPKAKK